MFTAFVASSLRRTLVASITLFLAVGVLGFAGSPQSPASASSTSGAAFTWGSGTNGELGDGSTVDSLVPVAVNSAGAMSAESIVEISGAWSTFCALTASGRVFCWGNGSGGQLGNGTDDSVSSPVAVDTSGVLAGKQATQISTLSDSACARTSDGGVYCWGANNFGELGVGNTTRSLVPTPVLTSGVLNGRTVLSLSSGGFATQCAVLDDGKLSCWGAGIFGQMGNGTNSVVNSAPTLVDSSGVLAGKVIAQVAVGSFHVCALTTDNVLACWGRNDSGQLGNGTLINRNIPTLVDMSGPMAGKTISTVSAGGGSTCVTTTVGDAYCWGDNQEAQLGNGTRVNSSVPTSVDTTGIFAGEQIATISVGLESGCATTATGRAACWGTAANGQLGNGTRGPALSPVWVEATGVLANVFVEQIAAAYLGTAAVGRIQIPPPAPVPVPPTPATAPLNVVAAAGDASATVSWQLPASFGSFPISTYQVQAAPGDRTCLIGAPQTSCEITRLTNNVEYTFSVRALTGAGWSTWSQPSGAVTPQKVSIMITGSRAEARGRSGIVVTGATSGLDMGVILRPWVRLHGQPTFTQAATQVLVDESGDFIWQRRGNKTMTVYVATPDDATKSNHITIRAR